MIDETECRLNNVFDRLKEIKKEKNKKNQGGNE